MCGYGSQYNALGNRIRYIDDMCSLKQPVQIQKGLNSSSMSGPQQLYEGRSKVNALASHSIPGFGNESHHVSVTPAKRAGRCLLSHITQVRIFLFSEAVPLSWNLHLACTWIGRGTREPSYKTSCESLYNTFCNPHRAEEAVTLALASAGRAYLAWPTRGNVPPNRLSRANLCDSKLGDAQRHGRLRPVSAGTAR